MQEEVTGKSVALIVDCARMSEQVLEKAINAYLDAQKNKQPKIYRGKQSLKHLSQQNAGLASIEISDKNIKDFDRVARKYGIDYAVKKDTTEEIPKYLVFFKARDGDALNAAFREYSAVVAKKKERPSVIQKLRAINPLEQAVKKDRVRHKDKGLEL